MRDKCGTTYLIPRRLVNVDLLWPVADEERRGACAAVHHRHALEDNLREDKGLVGVVALFRLKHAAAVVVHVAHLARNRHTLCSHRRAKGRGLRNEGGEWGGGNRKSEEGRRRIRVGWGGERKSEEGRRRIGVWWGGERSGK